MVKFSSTRLTARLGFVVVAAMLLAGGPASVVQAQDDGGELGVAAEQLRLVQGPTVQVDGRPVQTWARLDADNRPVEVGVTVAYGILANPPAEPGTGPANAIAVVGFPSEVQDKTFFNNFQIHWEAGGHPPEPFLLPHFDLHFYNMPVDQVVGISAEDTSPPEPSRLPPNYIYPGPQETVPQMGVHAVDPQDLQKPFTEVLIFGYYGGRMTFIEPMVTRAVFEQKQEFDLEVPRPQQLGERTLYPTRFIARYDQAADAYRFVFSGFVEQQ